MARTYNDIYYNDDENSTAEILDDMKKLAESVDQQIGSIKSFNNDTSQFIEQVTPLMNNLSEQVIDMHQLADTMFTELEQVKEENKQLREDLNGLPKGQASGESIDLNDSAEMRCDLKISGNSEQETREGYQLLNLQSGMQNGITYYVDDEGYFCISGTCTSDRITLELNEMVLNGTYTFTNKSISGRGINCALKDNTSEYKTIFWANNNNNTKEVNVILKDLVCYLTNGATYNSKVKLMLVSGSQEKDIEQYGASPSPDYPSEVKSCGDNGSINEVICNKNIFDGKLETGEYDVLGNKISNSGRYRNVNKITIEENETYFFSIDGVGKNYVLYFYDKNGNFLTTGNTDNYKVKTPSHAKYMNFRCFVADYVADYSNLKIQIEKNTIVTSFEQHKEQSYTIPTQQPMRAIGNVRDKFILKENGKWYERHYSYRLILDGTETWELESVGRFGIIRSKLPKIPKAVANNNAYIGNMCNYYKESTPTLTWGKKQGFCIDISSCLRIYDNTYSSNNDLEGFKSWLSEKYNAGTPVYVDYLLAEPLDIECTEEQSTILDQIENEAKTYKNVTHIYSTDEISPVIDVTYKKDIETLFANTLVEGV